VEERVNGSPHHDPIIVSLATGKPSEETLQKFDESQTVF